MRRSLFVAQVVVLLLTAAMSSTAYATPPSPSGPTGVIPVTGVCTFGSDSTEVLTASFSPALTAISGGLSSISGTGNCTTSAGVMTVTVSLAFFMSSWNCAGGVALGSSGSLSFHSTSMPTLNNLETAATGGPASIGVAASDVVSLFAASISLAWSVFGGQIQACPLGGVTSTPLTGAMYFALA